MTWDGYLVWVLVALVGLGGSAMWSGLETGLYCMSRVRLAVRAGVPGRHGAPARVLAKQLEKPDSVLATILLGNNVCNYLGTLGLTAVLEAQGFSTAAMVLLQVAVLTPMLLVFGESLPKEVFRVRADQFPLALANVLRAVRFVATITGVLPLISGFAWVAARLTGAPSADLSKPEGERLAELFRESASSGAISTEQVKLAERAMEFGQRRVRDRMVPWSRVDAVSAGWTRERVLKAVSRSPHTRVVVIGPSGGVVGIADRLALQADPGATLESVTGPAIWLDADMGLRAALVRLREGGTPLGLVGGSERPIGLVTVKDLVEPLTGALRAW